MKSRSLTNKTPPEVGLYLEDFCDCSVQVHLLIAFYFVIEVPFLRRNQNEDFDHLTHLFLMSIEMTLLEDEEACMFTT